MAIINFDLSIPKSNEQLASRNKYLLWIFLICTCCVFVMYIINPRFDIELNNTTAYFIVFYMFSPLTATLAGIVLVAQNGTFIQSGKWRLASNLIIFGEIIPMVFYKYEPLRYGGQAMMHVGVIYYYLFFIRKKEKSALDYLKVCWMITAHVLLTYAIAGIHTWPGYTTQVILVESSALFVMVIFFVIKAWRDTTLFNPVSILPRKKK